MTIQKKREALKAAYPGKKWSDKIDDMSDKEVTEIYTRLKNQGKV